MSCIAASSSTRRKITRYFGQQHQAKLPALRSAAQKLPLTDCTYTPLSLLAMPVPPPIPTCATAPARPCVPIDSSRFSLPRTGIGANRYFLSPAFPLVSSCLDTSLPGLGGASARDSEGLRRGTFEALSTGPLGRSLEADSVSGIVTRRGWTTFSDPKALRDAHECVTNLQRSYADCVECASWQRRARLPCSNKNHLDSAACVPSNTAACARSDAVSSDSACASCTHRHTVRRVQQHQPRSHQGD